jgi:RimJ/RimL family protein N-acetyltransferase
MADSTRDRVLSTAEVMRARERGLPLAYDCGLNGWVVTEDGASMKARPTGGEPAELGFRPWDLSDLPTYLRLLRDPEVWRFLPEEYPRPFTEETARGLMEVGSLAALHDVVAVVWKGRPIGQCLCRPERGSGAVRIAEVGYWLGRAYWGQGLMSRILPPFTHRCFARHRVDVLYASIRRDHAASVRVAERAGFRRSDPAFDATLAGIPSSPGFERYVLSRAAAPHPA